GPRARAARRARQRRKTGGMFRPARRPAEESGRRPRHQIERALSTQSYHEGRSEPGEHGRKECLEAVRGRRSSKEPVLIDEWGEKGIFARAEIDDAKIVARCRK